jgi:hypothetical protein
VSAINLEKNPFFLVLDDMPVVITPYLAREISGFNLCACIAKHWQQRTTE